MQTGIHHFPVRHLATVAAVVLLAACSGGGNAQDGQASAAVEARAADTDGAPLRISHGEEVDIAEYAVPGQITVFDFMSEFCPPCQRIAPWMDRLNAERDGVTVVKVDINRPGIRGIDWKSPVAAQYRLSSIPHFKVIDAGGELVAEGDAAWEMIVGWLEELPQPDQADQG